MRLVFTILLLAGIFLSYFSVKSLLHKDVSVAGNSFGFSQTDQNIRDLNQFDEYQVVTARPLFDRDREPAKVVVEKKTIVKKVVAKPLKVQALGIAVTGEILLAVVKDLRTGKIHRLRIDEEIDGWALTSVSADSFVFNKDEIEKAVKFKPDRE